MLQSKPYLRQGRLVPLTLSTITLCHKTVRSRHYMHIPRKELHLRPSRALLCFPPAAASGKHFCRSGPQAEHHRHVRNAHAVFCSTALALVCNGCPKDGGTQPYTPNIIKINIINNILIIIFNNICY